MIVWEYYDWKTMRTSSRQFGKNMMEKVEECENGELEIILMLGAWPQSHKWAVSSCKY